MRESCWPTKFSVWCPFRNEDMTKMAYNIDWIIPRMRNPTKLWNIASTLTMAAVGLFSKILISTLSSGICFQQINNVHFSGWLNKTKVHNREIMCTLLDDRPQNVPLVTISNHHSCFDDPGIWGKKMS